MFPQVFGKYVLEREIASGGMARVYLATLRGAGGFEKRLVVKQIRPELASDDAFVRRFVDEAKTTVELSHPNIVPVYELGVEQGTYYIAMEFCEGVTLAELLEATGPLSPEEGAYVGVEICRALDYAHRRAGIVHRDVTPRNVIVNDEGGVRLIDFGIAAPAAGGATGPAEVFGSPGHMPPEQLDGRALTPATDVFAVAVLLIETWSGDPPFRRSSVEEFRAALRVEPPKVGDIDERLRPLSEIVRRSVALNPAERPESAEYLARSLRQFLRESELGELERRLGERVARARRRSLAKAEDHRPAVPGPITPVMTARADNTGRSIETLTFAAREDVGVWTRKIPTDPPGATPVADEAAAARRDARTLRLETSHASGGDPDAQPIAAGEPRVAVTPRAPIPRYVALGVAALLAAGVVTSRWAKQREEAFATPREHGGASPMARPLGSPPAAAALAMPPPSAPGAELLPSASRPREPVVRRPVASAPPRSAEERATLTLSSDPPARVSVAGRVGQTPFTVRDLETGTYQVVFQEPTLNERLVGTVQVAPGDRRRLHADFTGSKPRLY